VNKVSTSRNEEIHQPIDVVEGILKEQHKNILK